MDNATKTLRLVFDEAEGYNVVLAPSDEYEGAHFTLIGIGDLQAELGQRIVRAVNQHAALLRCAEALRQMVSAIDAGGIDSEGVEFDDSEQQPHKWHEEWAHHARSALSALEQSNGG